MAYFRKLTPSLTAEEVEKWFSGKQPAAQRPVICGTFEGRAYESKDDAALNIHPPQSSARSTIYDTSDSESDEEYSCISGDMQRLDLESSAPSVAPSVIVNKAASVLVYDNYNFTMKYNKSLPIVKHRSDILATIRSNKVTVVQGSTGSGKTTQVPMFILDEHAKAREHCNIVVTQPPKIAAVSIARRVCQERQWQVGQVVGYQVGLDKMTSEDTRITYVTTGVLLRHLVKMKHMNEYTHVILDEVHERDKDTDFALLLVKKLLNLNSNQVKVVLMSATMDTEEFANYFSQTIIDNHPVMAPSLSVSGRLYTVIEHFIEELDTTRFGQAPQINFFEPEISNEMYVFAAKLIFYLDELEKGDANESPTNMTRGSVLVFLPGLFQITEMANLLKVKEADKKLKIIPLHSSITLDEQGEVFKKSVPGFRKIILSTNIAESSLTVPDVKYVVDFCLTKCMVCDPDTNYQSLQLQWTSKSSCRQRAGRAGRVSNGRVYRLVTRHFWELNIPEFGTPELQRCSLESAILNVKLLDLGPPKSVLALAISPPDLNNIERTVLILKEIGALCASAKNKRYDGNLTFVGKVLAHLPLDMRLGKLLMLGFVFGCLNDCLIIAASLSKQSFLSTPYGRNVESYRKKLFWANGSFSDCISLLNAYKSWRRQVDNLQFRNRKAEETWAKENFIQIRRIREVHAQLLEIQHRLSTFNIRGYDFEDEEDGEENSLLILQMVMAAAFYPNFFEELHIDDQITAKEMSNLDPTRTVMLNGFPNNKAFLYRDSILKATAKCGKPKAVFYSGAKAFVEFENASSLNTGSVLPSVYLACKMRDTKRTLQLFQSNEEVEIAPGNHHKISPFMYELVNAPKHSTAIPRLGRQQGKVEDDLWMTMEITYVESCTLMYGQELSEEVSSYLAQIGYSITKHCEEESLNFVTNVQEGDLVLAPYHDGEQTTYYRALVVRSVPRISVWFVDYGNMDDKIDRSSLMELPAELNDIPFLAVRMQLKGIQPLHTVSAVESKKFLLECLSSVNNIVLVRVYCVMNNIVHVDMFQNYTDERTYTKYINQILINEDFCEAIADGRIMQLSHDSWKLSLERKFPDEQTDPNGYFGWDKLDQSLRGPAVRSPKGMVMVHGPRSTFETSFYSIIRVGRNRKTNVDINSINNVAINQQPNNPNPVVMVSGVVTMNQTGSAMQCRYTTRLPPIPALKSLLCLLFSPIIELRRSKDGTHFTGALCGLGSIKTSRGNVSILPDHDIELVFDKTITAKDIIDINGIRMMINMAVGSSEKIAEWSASVIRRIQAKARDKLLTLLSRKRDPVDEEHCLRPYQWKLIDEHLVVRPAVYDEKADLSYFYPLHNSVHLTRLDESKYY